MTGSLSFTWIGAATGDWNDAANWDQIPSVPNQTLVPGDLDTAIISNTDAAQQTITGNGGSASLTLQGNETVLGDLNTGTLTVAGNPTTLSTLDVAAGATVSANSATVTVTVTSSPTVIVFPQVTIAVSGSAALFKVDDALQFDTNFEGGLFVTDGGFAQAGDIDLGKFDELSDDATSMIVIGNAHTGTVGTINVDLGAVLSGGDMVTGNIVDNGLIRGELALGIPTRSTLGGGPIYQSLSGSGTVEAESGGAITVGDSVASPGLTFQVDGGAGLIVQGNIAAGNTIDLDGSNDTLSLGSPSNDLIPGSGSAPDPTVMAAIVNGFNATDALIVNQATITSTGYQAGIGGDPGTLTLLNGASVVNKLGLTGSFTGQNFQIEPLNDGGVQIILLNGPGSTTPGPGTATGDTYSWNGANQGDWNAATNWTDVSAGQTPAAVAPGALDVVTVDNTDTIATTLQGDGNSASLTLIGANEVLGNLNTALLTVGSAKPLSLYGLLKPLDLVVDPGATIRATAATILTNLSPPVAGGNNILVSGNGALFQVAGTLSFGGNGFGPGLSVANGGEVRVGDVLLNPSGAALSVDDASSIEIGNAGSAVAGAIVVDQGASLVGSNDDAGNIIDNGLIETSPLTSRLYLRLGSPTFGTIGTGPFPALDYTFQSLSGTGTIEALTGGTITVGETVATAGLTFELQGTAGLDLEGDVAAGNTIDLNGNANTLTFGEVGYSPGLIPPPSTIAATINGFNATDEILFYGEPIAGAEFSPGAPGTLTLLNSGTAVLDLDLAGSFPTNGFSVASLGTAESQITLAPACFAAGTRILSAAGEVPVETLHVGDLLRVRFREDLQPIVWIGHRQVDCRRHPRPADVWPVRIATSAFGPGRPRRGLLLSPDHAVLVNDVLIPIKYLINDTSIAQVPMDSITYYHIELPHHDVIVAEGLPSESYLNTGGRANFPNAGGAVALHVDFAAMRWEAAGCVQMIVTGPRLDAARQRLNARAANIAVAGAISGTAA